MERRSAILLGLFLAVAGAFYLLEIRGASERGAARVLEETLFRLESADVARVELSSGVVLERTAQGFEMRSPVIAPVDHMAVGRFLGAILAIRRESRFPVPAESLAAFGFAPARAWCVLTNRAGSSRRVDLGATTATGNHLYARDPDTGECAVVWGSILREFQMRPDELRDRRLVSARIGEIDAFRVERPADTLVVARDASRLWRIVSPVASRASVELTSALLQRLTDARAARFADDASADSLLRLTDGSARRTLILTLSPDRGGLATSRAETLLVDFPSGPLAAPVAVRAAAQPRPVNVDLDLVVWLDAAAESLRATRLLPLPPDQATRFDVARDTASVTLVRDADSWRLLAPFASGADPIRARALLRNLDNERIAAWAPAVSRTSAGLDTPRARVRVVYDNLPEGDGFAIGAAAPGGDLYAAFDGEPDVFLVAPRVLEFISADPWDYEAREILAAAVGGARSVRVTAEGRDELNIERSGDIWRESNGRLDAAAAGALAARLARVAPLDQLPVDSRGAGLGFDAPTLTVQWDGDRPGRFEVGGLLDPDRRFARSSLRPGALFVFFAPDLDSLLP
ncbi:MAG: DUF4340 domain-containing protein [bacterium]